MVDFLPLKFSEVYLIVIGVTFSIVGWTCNQYYALILQQHENNIERYKLALREFYWPLLFKWIEFRYYVQLHQNDSTFDNESVEKLIHEIIRHVNENIGIGFPKKTIAHPLCIIIPKLLRGVHEGNPLAYVSLESVDIFYSILESRIVVMAKKYNAYCGEDEIDRYTYALYAKILNYIQYSREREWFTSYEWYANYPALIAKARENKIAVLTRFYEVFYKTSEEENTDNKTFDSRKFFEELDDDSDQMKYRASEHLECHKKHGMNDNNDSTDGSKLTSMNSDSESDEESKCEKGKKKETMHVSFVGAEEEKKKDSQTHTQSQKAQLSQSYRKKFQAAQGFVKLHVLRGSHSHASEASSVNNYSTELKSFKEVSTLNANKFFLHTPPLPYRNNFLVRQSSVQSNHSPSSTETSLFSDSTHVRWVKDMVTPSSSGTFNNNTPIQALLVPFYACWRFFSVQRVSDEE